MFNHPVVFIVGAGASKEYGLPTGVELRNEVVQLVRSPSSGGSPELFDQFHELFGDETDGTPGNELAAAIPMFPSIDEALHFFSSREEIILLGKAAIVHLILTSERNSNLFREGPSARAFDPIEDGWIRHFCSMALSAIRKEEVLTAFEKVTLIIFNYDRVVEHYLYEALQNQAGLTPADAQESLAKMKVIRPYGSVGPLSWQDDKGIPFGGNQHGEIARLSQAMRTYTEQLEGSEITEEISRVIEKANLAVFLGFGFHQQNMSLLQATKDTLTNVYATTMGFHSHTYEHVSNSIATRLRTSSGLIKLHAMPAHLMLNSLRPSIMAIT